jgi:hypothetical protein
MDSDGNNWRLAIYVNKKKTNKCIYE